MSYRGEYIFDGYIKGRGMVRVFSDLDNSKFVFARSMKKDVEWYVQRSIVEPRKSRKTSSNGIVSPKAVVAPDIHNNDSQRILQSVQGVLF